MYRCSMALLSLSRFSHHWQSQMANMNKVVVHLDDSHRQRPRENNNNDPSDPPQLLYTGWIPDGYSIAHLRQDAAQYWQIDAAKYDLFDLLNNEMIDDTQCGISQTTDFVFRKRCHFMKGTSGDPRSDPFWLQEKLFDVFLSHALPTCSGNGALQISCYQFKQLILKSVQSKLVRDGNKKLPHNFVMRIVLAFRTASSSSGGAGATFEQFLDALIDVGIYIYRLQRGNSHAQKEHVLEEFAMNFLIPHQSRIEAWVVNDMLGWGEMDDLVTRPRVVSIIQRFAQSLGELARAFSSSISGLKHLQVLQYPEFMRLVQEVKPSSIPWNTVEICQVFIHCCRQEQIQSESSPGLMQTAGMDRSRARSKDSRSQESLGNTLTMEEGNRSNSIRVSCTRVAHIFAYLALITVPRLVVSTTSKTSKERKLGGLDSSSPRAHRHIGTNLAVLSIKAVFQHIALRLRNSFERTTKIVANSRPAHAYSLKNNTSLSIATGAFLLEFRRMHHEDQLEDYLSSSFFPQLCEPLLEHREFNDRPNTFVGVPSPEFDDHNSTDQPTDQQEGIASEISEHELELEIEWGEDALPESDPDNAEVVNVKGDNVLNPEDLADGYVSETMELIGILNNADEIYAFLATELKRLADENRLGDSSTVPQMLDIWVTAGQKYAQVINYLDTPRNESPYHRTLQSAIRKACFLERFGVSLYVFARQLLRGTTKVFNYEDLFHVANARIHNNVTSRLWNDGDDAAFTLDLAMESLSLASGKFGHACSELEIMLDEIEDPLESNPMMDQPSVEDPAQYLSKLTSPKLSLIDRYLKCIWHRSNCLVMYGDVLAHNTCCIVDCELGCALEDDYDRAQKRTGDNATLQFSSYSSDVALSKSSSPGQFYREAKRMVRFLLNHSENYPASRAVWDAKVHHLMAMVEFKLATHLPHGCLAEKRLLDDVILHLNACCSQPHLNGDEGYSLSDCDPISNKYVNFKKRYIRAISVVRHKFFQPETAHATDHSDRDPVVPFYRYVLAAAFRDCDPDKTGILTQAQLTQLNTTCGLRGVSDCVMTWLLENFENSGKRGLTEGGLLQYFCWFAEADPLNFCDILDVLTEKYTETKASITSTIAAHGGKERQATSLRATLFKRRQSPSTTSLTLSERKPTGIAQSIVVLAGRMSKEMVSNLSQTKGPSDVHLEPVVIDSLPVGCQFPDELSKFCFPDDIYMSDEPSPHRVFDIVLTDISGTRLYGSCFHFSEEKDPIDVLALISSVQRGGSTARLPSWVSLKDIQQRQTKWRCFIPKCLCILSCTPRFQTLRDAVTQLYRLSISLPPYPVESFVFNLLAQVPLPTPEMRISCFSLVDRFGLLTALPVAAPHLHSDQVDFTLLFQCLSLENILKVYGYLLTEKKIVLVSRNEAILTPVAETLRALLYPFECQVVYIPVLPIALLDFVAAPVPFFMGVRSDKKMDRLTSEGVVVVDLDRDELALPITETLPSLPEVKARKLLQSLRKATAWVASQCTLNNYGRFQRGEITEITQFDALSQANNKEITERVRHQDDLAEKWTEIYMLFTTFAMRMLKDFQKFCVANVSADGKTTTTAFQKKSFLLMHPTQREFCTHLFQTQLFERFVEHSPTLRESLLQLATSDADTSWRGVRSKTLLSRKSEVSVDGSPRITPLNIQRAPGPPPIPNSMLSPPTHRRKLSGRGPAGVFAVFNAQIYHALFAEYTNSAQDMATGMVNNWPSSSPQQKIHGYKRKSHHSESYSASASDLLTHRDGSPECDSHSASDLVIAARLRLDTTPAMSD